MMNIALKDPVFRLMGFQLQNYIKYESNMVSETN